MGPLAFFFVNLSIICFAIYLNINFVIGCNSDTNVKIEFTSQIVDKVYIVSFYGYHDNDTRVTILTKCLENASISNWSVIPRDNEAYRQFDSDFELVHFGDEAKKAIPRLLRHPMIHQVTVQRQLQRTIKYSKNTECGPDGCLYSGWRNTKRRTRSIKSNGKDEDDDGFASRKLFRSTHTEPQQLTTIMGADKLWAKGITGKGVKIAVFDTGLAQNHPHFKRVMEQTDWTGEGTVDDALGHGTFVAGIIASVSGCLGFAPDADLHIYRVFTDNQVSYTSWFLDAFNYAIFKKIHIINLSIGGPDFMDRPFVDKVWELTANKVIMVSAIGNDGPMYGTLNNPADQMDVIGVGGIGFDNRLAKFSSRGMTTWELPFGYGRLKPDVVAYGSGVRGSSLGGGCKSLSGTSVASPVVAGVIALIISGVNPENVSPASVKQALISTAIRLPGLNMFEQGHGRIDLIAAYLYLLNYTSRATVSPPYLDMKETPYMWPYSSQPLYYSSQPVIVNFTVINGHGVSGNIVNVVWHPHNPDGNVLALSADHIDIVWPWSGWLAISLTVRESGANYEGTVEGHVNVTIMTYDVASTQKDNREIMNITIPIRARIIPVPARNWRVLWDQFHSLRYPGGFFPRDDLRAKHDPLDWHADHVHTNFRDMYNRLREQGYYVEVLGAPFTCVNTSLYGAFLLVDPEDEYFPEELVALKKAVDSGMSLIVFADWYNASLLRYVKFYDENTRQWWIPETGGANIPALNDLLGMFQIALGDRVFEGTFRLAGRPMYYASGTHIHSFPEHGIVVTAKLTDQGEQIMSGEKPKRANAPNVRKKVDVPIVGLLQTGTEVQAPNEAGRVVVFGDSSCLESGAVRNCLWLLSLSLQYATSGRVPTSLKEAANEHRDVQIIPSELPKRPQGGRLSKYSRVLLPDGSGQRPLPECIALPPTHTVPVDAPPWPRTLAPRHEPPNPQAIGAPEMDAIDTPEGASSDARDPEPWPETISLNNIHTVFASRMLTLCFIFFMLYCIHTCWTGCGRLMRRRKTVPMAT